MSNIIIASPPTEQQVKEQARKADNNVVTSISSKSAFKYNVKYHKMTDFLGLTTDDKMDSDLAEKVSFIRDYTKEKDELDAMVKIRDMIRDLGLQSKGKELVVNLYKYARLASERERIDKEINLLNGS